MSRRRSLYCQKCGAHKQLEKNGTLRCRDCATEWDKRQYHETATKRAYYRNRHLIRNYGVTFEQVKGLFLAQGERCAICLRHWTECPAPRPSRYEDGFLQHLHVDHDHRSGQVRGLLCHGCNGAIAFFNDDPDRLDAAATYLEANP